VSEYGQKKPALNAFVRDRPKSCANWVCYSFAEVRTKLELASNLSGSTLFRGMNTRLRKVGEETGLFSWAGTYWKKEKNQELIV